MTSGDDLQPGALVFAAADALGSWLEGFAVVDLPCDASGDGGGWSAWCKIAVRNRDAAGLMVSREQTITVELQSRRAAPTSALARALIEAAAVLDRWGVSFGLDPVARLAAAVASAIERGEVGP